MVGERSSEGRGVREERRGRDREQVREYTLNGSTIILMIIIRFSRQTHPAINHEIAPRIELHVPGEEHGPDRAERGLHFPGSEP